MKIPWDMIVQYITVCSRCNKTNIESAQHFRHGEILYPLLPEGWNNLNGSPICPIHKVEISR